MVLFGNARFTVLTAELVRMEWSADGRFDDGPSPVFINRHLPVPRFHHELSKDKQTLSIRTSALTLVYKAVSGTDGRFAPDNLTVVLSAGSNLVVWRPGMVDNQKLQPSAPMFVDAATPKTGDLNSSLMSRTGWALVDDTCRPMFNRTAIPPRQSEENAHPGGDACPQGGRKDWYFFGYGHDFKRVLGDYMLVTGHFPDTQIPGSLNSAAGIADHLELDRSILSATSPLRTALLPYINTETRRTIETGVPLFRPLYYDWPSNGRSYTTKNEYQFGEQMIVAPVDMSAGKSSGLVAEDIWLPPGDWIEWSTGKRLSGDATYTRTFSSDHPVIFLKAGAIVPTRPPVHSAGEEPVGNLVFDIWPLLENTTSAYSVYEDSAPSSEQHRGPSARTPVKASQTGDTLKVEIGPAHGGYPGMPAQRSYELRLPADWPPESVTVNGKPVDHASLSGTEGWTFEGNTLTTVIPVPATSVDSQVVIQVHRPKELLGKRDALDGFAGIMFRLRAACDAIRQALPDARLPGALVAAMQTGDRISSHPENMRQELAQLKQVLPQAQASLDELANDSPQKLDAAVAVDGSTPAVETPKQPHPDALTRARTLVAQAISR
jgi:hypothetical protein